MAYQYFIFRLVEGAKTRHQRLYLLEGDQWGPRKGKVLRGSLRKMQTLARSLSDGFPFLIIERFDVQVGRKGQLPSGKKASE